MPAAGEIVTNQFLGPPLGGFLFGLGAAVPILLDAGTFAISAGLIASLGGLIATRRPARDPDAVRPRMRTEIAEGLRWLRDHRTTAGVVTTTDTWLAEHPDAPAGLVRTVTEQRDTVARAVAAQERDAG